MDLPNAQAFRATTTYWRNSKPDPHFITVWKTNNPGTSNSKSITLPLVNGATYNFIVDWGDGSSSTITSSNAAARTHTYSVAGTYVVRMLGRFDRFAFGGDGDGDGNADNGGDKEKILNVAAWGTNKWTSMLDAFAGCTNLDITATDAPDLSLATSMAGMFDSATNFNGNIGHWNTSTITNMSYMFSGAAAFNRSLNSWNTANVTTMWYLFSGATAFNGDITSWNTGNVQDMEGVFENASSFNQNISAWNTGKVTNMAFMFYSASSFNQNISGWNTAKVTTMESIFHFASSFNQNLSGWNVGLVTNRANYRTGATAWTLPKPPGFP